MLEVEAQRMSMQQALSTSPVLAKYWPVKGRAGGHELALNSSESAITQHDKEIQEQRFK
jgi:hypothetical protein